MSRRGLSRGLMRPGLVAMAGVACTAICGTAGALEFDPRINATVLYSDNIRLAQPGSEESDVVGVVKPGLGIYHDSPRVKLAANYTFEYLAYQDATEGDANYSNGDLLLGLALVPDRLFLDSFAVLTQTLRDPSLPIPKTTTPLTENRTDALTLATTPRWIQPLWGGAELDIQVTGGLTDYDAPELQDSKFITSTSKLAGPRRDTGLSWSLHHNYTRYEYDLPPISREQQAYAELEYGFGAFSLFASGGLESPYNDIPGDSLEDGVWRAGARHESRRTRLEAFFGRRSFGNTLGASLIRQVKDGVISVSYSEEPRRQEDIFQARVRPSEIPRTAGEVVPEPPPLDNPPTVPPDIDVPGDGTTFIYKTLQADFTRRFSRHTLSLLAFWEERSEPILQDGQQLNVDINQAGGGLTWKYQLGRRTDVAFSGQYTRRDDTRTSPDLATDTIIDLRAQLTRQLAARVPLTLYYSRVDLDGEDVPGGTYVVNEVGLTIGWEFGAPNRERNQRNPAL